MVAPSEKEAWTRKRPVEPLGRREAILFALASYPSVCGPVGSRTYLNPASKTGQHGAQQEALEGAAGPLAKTGNGHEQRAEGSCLVESAQTEPYEYRT